MRLALVKYSRVPNFTGFGEMSDRIVAQPKKVNTPAFTPPTSTPLTHGSTLTPVATLQLKTEGHSSLQKMALSVSKQEAPDLQTQLDRAARFGHNFSRVQIHTNPPAAIQPKLTIGQPGDEYEQEADRLAEQVMTMSALVNRQPLQHPTQEEQIQAKTLGSITPVIQRQVEEEQIYAQPVVQLPVQDNSSPSPSLENRLSTQRGGGSPLNNEVRSFMEPRFGVDFSQVRVHIDSESTQMNQELNAQAFAHGSDIYFGAGKYNPGSSDGKQLLAHELTHVIQQTGGVQRQSVPLTVQQGAVEQQLPANQLISETGSEQIQLYSWNDFKKDVGNAGDAISKGVEKIGNWTKEQFTGNQDEIEELLKRKEQEAAAVVQQAQEKAASLLGTPDTNIDIKIFGRRIKFQLKGTPGARAEAAKIIEEAKRKAAQIIESAKLEAAQIIENANRKAQQRVEEAKLEAAQIAEQAKSDAEQLMQSGYFVEAKELTEREKIKANELVKEAQLEADQLIESEQARATQLVENAKIQADQLVQQEQARADQVVQAAQAPVEQILQEAQSQADQIREEAKAEAESRKNSNPVSQFVSWIGNKINQFSNWCQEKKDQAVNWCQEKKDQAVNWCQEKKEQLLNFYQEKKEQINHAIKEGKQALKEAGQAIKEGLKEAVQVVVAVIEQVVDALVGPFKLLYELTQLVQSVSSQAGGVIDKIFADPFGFVGNLFDGLKQGFQSFVDKVLQHLENGLKTFLFGALGNTGLKLPQEFSLEGILDLAMQLLGLSYDKLRERGVQKLGEENVVLLEQGVDAAKSGKVSFAGAQAEKYARSQAQGNPYIEQAAHLFQALKGGLKGIGQFFSNINLGELFSMVVDGVKSYLIEKVLMLAIPRIAAYLVPGAGWLLACIDALRLMYSLFIENIQKLKALVESISQSVVEAANGAIANAATLVESGLAQTVPLLIQVLADWLGVGDIGKTIKQFLDKGANWVNTTIVPAIDAVIDTVASLFSGMSVGGKPQAKTEATGEASNKAESSYSVTDAAVTSTLSGLLPGAKGEQGNPIDIHGMVGNLIATEAQQPFDNLTVAQTMLGQVFPIFQPIGLKSLDLKKADQEGTTYDVIATASLPRKVGAMKVNKPAEKQSKIPHSPGLIWRVSVPKPSGWVSVIPTYLFLPQGEPFEVPHFLKVQEQSKSGSTKNVKLLEGHFEGKDAEIDASSLMAAIAPSSSSALKFVEQKTLHNVKSGRATSIEGNLWYGSEGPIRATIDAANPIPMGTHVVEIPDFQHKGGSSYGDFGTTWFRIGNSGDRYLHPGRVSAGCVTIRDFSKWPSVWSYLISARKDNYSVGEIEVVYKVR